MQVTSNRPPVDSALVIEYHPPRWSVEGEGPTWTIPVADLENWPHVVSSHLGS